MPFAGLICFSSGCKPQSSEGRADNSFFSCVAKNKQLYFSAFAVSTGGCEAREAGVVSLGAGTSQVVQHRGQQPQQPKTLMQRWGVSIK